MRLLTARMSFVEPIEVVVEPDSAESIYEAEGTDLPIHRTVRERHVDESVKCRTGKLPFLTPQGAQKMLKTFKRRRDEWRQRKCYLTTYKCSYCRCWHLGNAEKFQSGWTKSERARRPRHLPEQSHKHKKKKGKRPHTRKHRRVFPIDDDGEAPDTQT
jgi:hypothetical protein